MRTTTQTTFTFSPELFRRMENKAHLLGKSVNAYVVELVKKDLEAEEVRCEELYNELAGISLPKSTSQEVASFMERYKIEFTQQEINEDERLAYLLEK